MIQDEIVIIQALREAVREFDQSIYDLEHGFDVLYVFSRWQDYGLKGACHVCRDRERDAGDCALTLHGCSCTQGDMFASFNAMRRISHSDPSERRKPEFREAFIRALKMRRRAIMARTKALGLDLGWTRQDRRDIRMTITGTAAISGVLLLAKLFGLLPWPWWLAVSPALAVLIVAMPGLFVYHVIAKDDT